MIAILKYNAGNVTSVENAVKQLGFDVVITDDFETLRSAEKIIFPGVGEARSAMDYLQQKGLDKLLITLKQPVLGICLGMQLMCNYSEEGDTNGLGIFDTEVVKFPAIGLVPHMGWNNFTSVSSALFTNTNLTDDCYFVHSYYAKINRQTSAICDYTVPFSAALQRDNFYGTQFHPEKSAITGIRILQNFLQL